MDVRKVMVIMIGFTVPLLSLSLAAHSYLSRASVLHPAFPLKRFNFPARLRDIKFVFCYGICNNRECLPVIRDAEHFEICLRSCFNECSL